MDTLTIIIPCFNEEQNILTFYNEVIKVLDNLKNQYQVVSNLLFVDDGSTDNTSEVVKKLASDYPEIVSYIVLSRNFGKEAALYAGFCHSKADYTAVMDVDLQDPPELLIEMYLGIKNEGFDCVAARRKNRAGEPLIRSFFAKIFYYLIRKLSGLQIVDGARDFRIINKQMLDAILSIKESNRFSKGLFPWVGFKTKWIEFENIERTSGITKWSFSKLMFYALDGIAAFSSAPLIAVSIFGIISMLLSLLLIIVIIVRKIIYDDPVAGWPSLVCFILFTSSLQYFFTGIIGFYVAKIYNETKHRPQFIIKYDSLNQKQP